MKIAIVGSREYKYLERVKEYVNSLNPLSDTIVSGGARGVDKVAEASARDRGMEVIIFYPDWDGKGKAAGFIRNQEIVDNSDVVVAFWDGESRGTEDTINKALAAYNIKEVRVFK